EVVENFLKFSLEFNYNEHPELDNIIALIVDSELGVVYHSEDKQTMTVKSMRNEKFRDEKTRWQLREQIIEELWGQQRIDNDEEIALERGGALPRSHVMANKQVFLITGLPASGKSGIANTIADDYGAVIIDSDYAKR